MPCVNRNTSYAYEKKKEEEFRRKEADRKKKIEEAKKFAAENIPKIQSMLKACNDFGYVEKWCPEEFKLIKDNVASLLSSKTPGQSELQKIINNIEKLQEKASQIAGREERRQFLVKSFVSALTQNSFVVSQPKLVDPKDLSSDVIVTAVKRSGGQITIGIPRTGSIWYNVESYVHHLTMESHDIGSAKANGEIDAIRKILSSRFGIKLGETTYVNANPNKIERMADDLPISIAKHQHH